MDPDIVIIHIESKVISSRLKKSLRVRNTKDLDVGDAIDISSPRPDSNTPLNQER